MQKPKRGNLSCKVTWAAFLDLILHSVPNKLPCCVEPSTLGETFLTWSSRSVCRNQLKMQHSKLVPCTLLNYSFGFLRFWPAFNLFLAHFKMHFRRKTVVRCSLFLYINVVGILIYDDHHSIIKLTQIWPCRLKRTLKWIGWNCNFMNSYFFPSIDLVSAQTIPGGNKRRGTFFNWSLLSWADTAVFPLCLNLDHVNVRYIFPLFWWTRPLTRFIFSISLVYTMSCSPVVTRRLWLSWICWHCTCTLLYFLHI